MACWEAPVPEGENLESWREALANSLYSVTSGTLSSRWGKTPWPSAHSDNFCLAPSFRAVGRICGRNLALGFGGQGRRAHTATLENQSAQLLNQEPRWGGRLGTPAPPRQHACLQAAVTYPPRFKVQAAQFPWIPDPAPTPSSAGPDAAKQRFTGSPAVTIPRASPPRRNRGGRIISDIISLILNEALWPQLPASPLSFRRP